MHRVGVLLFTVPTVVSDLTFTSESIIFSSSSSFLHASSLDIVHLIKFAKRSYIHETSFHSLCSGQSSIKHSSMILLEPIVNYLNWSILVSKSIINLKERYTFTILICTKNMKRAVPVSGLI